MNSAPTLGIVISAGRARGAIGSRLLTSSKLAAFDEFHAEVAGPRARPLRKWDDAMDDRDWRGFCFSGENASNALMLAH